MEEKGRVEGGPEGRAGWGRGRGRGDDGGRGERRGGSWVGKWGWGLGIQEIGRPENKENWDGLHQEVLEVESTGIFNICRVE